MISNGTDVSVLVATYRWGGMDVLLSGLAKQQTFSQALNRDIKWEIVLVDVLYDERKDALKAYIKEKGWEHIPLVHVKPFRDLYPAESGSKHRNCTIAYADGKIGVFLCDYASVRPDFVRRHYEIFEKFEENRRQPGGDVNGIFTAMSPHHYLLPPKLKPSWQSVSINTPLDQLPKEPISIFEEEFTPESMSKLEEQPIGQDPKLYLVDGTPIDPTYFHMKNEAVHMETIVNINGCNEKYDIDGGHICSDNELAYMLQNAYNKFILDKTNVIQIINPRAFYPTLKIKHETREIQCQADIAYYRSRQDANFPRDINQDMNLWLVRLERLQEKRKLLHATS